MKRAPSPRRPSDRPLTAWQQSARFRQMGSDNFTQYNQRRHFLPKCGANCRSTGEPCRDIAMANGRCFRHGGKTPTGDRWHQPVWPDKSAPNAMSKVHAKLKNRDRDALRRKRRLAAMSDDEQAAYREWQKSHKPGSAAAREARRLAIQRSQDARQRLSQPGSLPSPEVQALAERIAELRAKQVELRDLDITPFTTGVFE